jgi:hypothetical protein
VPVIHRDGADGPATCTGEVYTYAYRFYEPDHPSYERCIALTWCSTCRERSGNMGYVPRGERLWDATAELPAPERERLLGSESKLLDFLDRLVRRGEWPARRP